MHRAFPPLAEDRAEGLVYEPRHWLFAVLESGFGQVRGVRPVTEPHNGPLLFEAHLSHSVDEMVLRLLSLTASKCFKRWNVRTGSSRELPSDRRVTRTP